MKKLLMPLMLLLVILAGVSYYLGWWDTAAKNDGGKAGVGINVNKDKMNKDIDTAKQATIDAAKKAKEVTVNTFKAAKDKLSGFAKKLTGKTAEQKAAIEKEIADLNKEQDALEKELNSMDADDVQKFPTVKDALEKKIQELQKKIDVLEKKLG